MQMELGTWVGDCIVAWISNLPVCYCCLQFRPSDHERLYLVWRFAKVVMLMQYLRIVRLLFCTLQTRLRIRKVRFVFKGVVWKSWVRSWQVVLVLLRIRWQLAITIQCHLLLDGRHLVNIFNVCVLLSMKIIKFLIVGPLLFVSCFYTSGKLLHWLLVNFLHVVQISESHGWSSRCRPITCNPRHNLPFTAFMLFDFILNPLC